MTGVVVWAPAAAGAACPNEEVRVQQNATHLPDCRAYEQISPVDKNGYGVGGTLLFKTDGLVSPDGDRVSWRNLFPLPGSNVGTATALIGTRSADGEWEVSNVFPVANDALPGAGLPDQEMIPFAPTADQRRHLYIDRYEMPVPWLWVLREDGSRQRIVAASAVPSMQLGEPGVPFPEGVSQDGRHVLFTLTARIGPATGLPGSSRILYEWIDDGSNDGQGTLRVVNRTNDPAVTLLNTGHAALGGSHSGSARVSPVPYGLQGAISADGSRIFFQNPAPTSDTGASAALYLREDGETTTLLSAPAAGHTPSGAVTSVKFLAATSDGSRAFFYANRDLVPGAPAGGGMYRYDVGALSPLTFLTSTGQTITNAGIGSDDGTRVYYERPNGGSSDVYVNVDGEDRLVLAAANILGGFRTRSLAGNTVTPDGRYLAFRSNRGATVGLHHYDAETGVVTTIAPGSAATFSATTEFGLDRRGAGRAMSDDGRFVFFDTRDALAPEDVNSGADTDVSGGDTYRWDAADGQLALISSGRLGTPGVRNGHFVGSDSSGETAFIVSIVPLARTDRDQLADLYAVRVNGGRLVEDVPAGCSGDGCQGDSSGPGFDRAASGVVRSAGDARPAARASIRLVGPRGSVRVGSAGRVRVTVRAVRSGRVSAVLRAGGRRIGGASRTARGAGRTVLSLRLSKAGRRALAADGRLRVRVVVRANGQARSRSVVLRAAEPAGRRAGGR